MSTSTDVRPQPGHGRVDDDDRVAHIIKKDDHLRGYVLGEEVEALCGTRFVPSRDPERFPICEACRAVLERRFA